MTKRWDGRCPSQDNPSASGWCTIEVHADYDKGTWVKRCRYCGREAERGTL